MIWFSSSYNFYAQPVSEDQSILAFSGESWQLFFSRLVGETGKEQSQRLQDWSLKKILLAHLVFCLVMRKYPKMAEKSGKCYNTYTPAAAYSLLAFNLLCAPCFAAIGAIHREMNAKKWTWIAIGYQCGLAYLVSFVIYQLGHLLEGGQVALGTYLAILLMIGLVYVLFRQPKSKNQFYTILSLEGEE